MRFCECLAGSRRRELVSIAFGPRYGFGSRGSDRMWILGGYRQGYVAGYTSQPEDCPYLEVHDPWAVISGVVSRVTKVITTI